MLTKKKKIVYLIKEIVMYLGVRAHDMHVCATVLEGGVWF